MVILLSPLIPKALRLLVSAAIVSGIAFFFYSLVPSNIETIALTFLLAILGISTVWGLPEAITSSILAVLLLNYFFVPPLGWTLGGPRDWMALVAFLITAVTASQLSIRARRRAAEAMERRREAEKLHLLGQGMLLKEEAYETASELMDRIVGIFDVRGAAFYSKAENSIYRSGPEVSRISDEELRAAAASAEPIVAAKSQIAYVPVRRAEGTIGSIGFAGCLLSKEALNSVAYLVAIDAERTRSIMEANRIEAARQSEVLRTALLDALAHDLKTPLTSVKGAITHLLDKLHGHEEEELLILANEETDRLIHLSAEIIEMARIDAGKLHPERHPSAIGEIIETCIREFGERLNGHPIELQVPGSLHLVELDPDLIQKAIRQLLDNAIKYSPTGSAIAMSARLLNGSIVVSVTDQGPGIDAKDQPRVFDKFFRGPQWKYSVKGTGLGLSIAKGMVEAHGGDIWLSSEPGKGASFSFSLPVEQGSSSS